MTTKKKMKVTDVRPTPFEGKYLDDETGTYDITLVPTASGMCELHVWADPAGKGDSMPLNGSPLSLMVASGAPTAEKSYVDGYTNETSKQDALQKKHQHHDALR